MQVPFSVADFMYRAERVYGDRIGIVDEPDQPALSMGELGYREVAELARRQAARLDELGVGTGERVAILSQNSARLLISFYAVPGWGRVLVPINFRLSREEVAYIVEHSGSTVLLVDPELFHLVSDLAFENIVVLGSDGDLYARPGAVPRGWRTDENAVATINYTSGTTARPKGVELTHRNLWVNAVTFGLHFATTDRDVYLHTLPMFHVNGWGVPFIAAGLGIPQIVLRKVDGTEILRRVERHDVTLLCAAPAVIASVLEAALTWPGEIPGRGRTRIVVAGAPPPTATIARVERELGWEFTQLYGLTETSPLLTVNRSPAEWDHLTPEERAVKLGRAGSPAIGARLQVDEEGEVLARSNGVLGAYWKRPDETAAALQNGWFHTGDGGTVGDDGYLTISDRKKDVIITGGENVSSIEVEDVLFSHPAVAEVAIIGVPDDRWGETIKALVVLAPGADASEGDLISWCKARLAGYKAPTSVEFRDSLARTATGKLQKFKLRTPYWAGRESHVS